MKRKIAHIVILLLLSVYALSTGAAAAYTPKTEGIKWYTYADGMQKSRKDSKKIYLYFWSITCYYCGVMEEETFSDASVIDFLNKNFIPIKVDVDVEVDVAQNYQYRGLPHSFFLTSKGDQIRFSITKGDKFKSLPGFLPADAMLAILDFFYTDSYKKMYFMRFLKNG